jgi:hypothetical protein
MSPSRAKKLLLKDPLYLTWGQAKYIITAIILNNVEKDLCDCKHPLFSAKLN